MSRYDQYYDERPRNASPHRRRTPPHDARRGPGSDLKIRGLASGGDRARRDSFGRDTAQYDGYHRYSHPDHEQYSRHGGGDERDFSDDRHESDRAYDRRPGSGSRSPRTHRQRGDYHDRDDYRSSQRDIHGPAQDHNGGSHTKSPASDYLDEHAAAEATRERPRGEPSREVMLEGLSQDITEEHVKTELQQYFQVQDLESVRIIRNRDTGLTRGFGFLRFASVETATAFLDQNFPFIHLYGDKAGDKDAEGTKISIAFSRERERDIKVPEIREGDWICANCITHNFSKRVDCIKCGNPKSELHPTNSTYMSQRRPSHSFNNGQDDIAQYGPPSHILIFRPLEAKVTEELLARGAAKLLKSEETEGTAPRKIVSTAKVANAGANRESILRVLLVRDRTTDTSWGFGFVEFVSVEEAQAAVARFKSLEKFTISSKPVMVDYIHAGVFMPASVGLVPGQERHSIAASRNPSLRLVYRDGQAYVSELKVSEPKADYRVKAEDSKTPNAEDTKLKKRKADTTTDKPSKKIMQLPASLQTWVTRQAELRGESSLKPEERVSASDDSPAPADSSSSSVPVSQQSYADPDGLCCLLCQREFPIVANLHQHERQSKLHQSKLADAAAVAVATRKLVARGIPLAADQGRANEAYRDRAKERRDAFQQAKKPGFKGPGATPEQQQQQPEAQRSPSPTPPAPSAPAQSKGAALLGKMGWSKGQGLGAQGTGMTSAIEPALYAARVGLGAEGGRVGDAVEEAGRSTRNDAGEIRFSLKDKTRERFSRLG